jgi:hypothetical protein
VQPDRRAQSRACYACSAGLKIVEKHAGCHDVAEEARAAASGPATRPPTDALSALMAAKKMQQAADRAEAAVKAGGGAA